MVKKVSNETHGTLFKNASYKYKQNIILYQKMKKIPVLPEKLKKTKTKQEPTSET